MSDYGIEIPGGFFDEERHLYRDEKGTIVPSTTQVFDILGVTDLEGVPKHLLEWKRNYGLAVHAGVEYMTQGDLDWDSLDEQIIPAVTGVEQFLKKIEYKSESAEKIMVHCVFGMKYGLTIDNIGTMNYHDKRRHVILDLKTAVKEHIAWKWQLGAYSLPLPKVEGGWLGMNVQVDKEGNVKPFYHDLNVASREFQILLPAAILKLNAGLAKLG